MQGAVAFDGEAGNPAIDQGDGARFEIPAVDRSVLLDDNLGIIEVSDHRSQGVVAGDDEHRKCQRRTQVRIGAPDLVE